MAGQHRVVTHHHGDRRQRRLLGLRAPEDCPRRCNHNIPANVVTGLSTVSSQRGRSGRAWSKRGGHWKTASRLDPPLFDSRTGGPMVAGCGRGRVGKRSHSADASALLRAWGMATCRLATTFCRSSTSSSRSAAAYLRRERLEHTADRGARSKSSASSGRIGHLAESGSLLRHRGADDAANPRRLRSRTSSREAPRRQPARHAWMKAPAPPATRLEVLLLEQALEELSVLDPRQGQIVELRYWRTVRNRGCGNAAHFPIDSDEGMADGTGLAYRRITGEHKRGAR